MHNMLNDYYKVIGQVDPHYLLFLLPDDCSFDIAIIAHDSPGIIETSLEHDGGIQYIFRGVLIELVRRVNTMRLVKVVGN